MIIGSKNCRLVNAGAVYFQSYGIDNVYGRAKSDDTLVYYSLTVFEQCPTEPMSVFN